jgi:GT2 family glycosyltransferase
VAVVVATRNRPRQLAQLLAELPRQLLVPSAVVIVDSSDTQHRPDVERIAAQAGFPVRLEFTDVASLPSQRNAGVASLLAHETPVDLVQFLDDDVSPRADYMLRLASLFARDTVGAVAGASGISLDRLPVRNSLVAFYRRFFGLYSPRGGALLPGGHNMPVAVPTGRDAVVEADWLFGCSMWRLPVLRSSRFSDVMPGGALFEDVEFSVRARRAGRLVVDTGARIEHALAAEGRPDTRTHHQRWVRNRYAVVVAMGRDGSKVWFWWSTLGYFLAIARHLLGRDAEYRQAALGLLDGSLAVLRRRPMT